MGTDVHAGEGSAPGRPGEPLDPSDLEPFRHGAVAVAVRRAGAAGPGVVLLHNGGTSHAIWRHQIADLAIDHRVVAVDLPGFGASPQPSIPLDLDDHVDLVTALIDHDGLAPVALVGNCMGSAIAAGVAARRPAAVSALVLVNPLTHATFRAGGLGSLLAATDRWPAVTATLQALSRRVRLPEALAPQVLRYQLGPAGARAGLHHDPELVACVSRRAQLPALTGVLADLAASYRIARGPDAPPLLTLWGARNRVLSPAAGAELDRALQPDQRVLVRDTGHLPMLERPDEVTAAIRAFLADAVADDTRTVDRAVEVAR